MIKTLRKLQCQDCGQSVMGPMMECPGCMRLICDDCIDKYHHDDKGDKIRLNYTSSRYMN